VISRFFWSLFSPCHNSVLVLPVDAPLDEEIELHEYWVAKILDIRVGEDKDDAWAKVQWFWSGGDVAEQIKSLCVIVSCLRDFFSLSMILFSDASHRAQLERLLSDSYDYVSCQSFSGSRFRLFKFVHMLTECRCCQCEALRRRSFGSHGHILGTIFLEA
jgi:hypothetical protein